MKERTNFGVLFVGIFALIALLVVVFFFRKPTFPADITQFLPVDSESSIAAKELAKSGLSQHAILLIGGKEHGSISDEIAKSLGKSDLFLSVRNRPPQRPKSIHGLYFPRRYDFIADSFADLEKLKTKEGMDSAATRFIASLGGRYGTMMQRLGPKDPLLAYVGILDRLNSLLGPELEIVDGRYRTKSDASVIFVELKHSAFDANNAKAVDALIKGRFEASKNVDSTLSVAAAYPYTLAISTIIKRDIQRITFIGFLGLLLIFGVVFGRIGFVLLPLLSIAFGGGLAFAVTSLVFGEVHLIALAFGASLIGVCVDYAIHYLNHPHESSHKVWPAIRVGALTTIGGFIVLFSSSVSALHQIGLFASVGVLGSVLATWAISQTITQGPQRARHLKATAKTAKVVEQLRSRPLLGMLLTLPVFVLIVVGLPSFALEKNLDAIRNPTPKIKTEEREVRQKVSGSQSGAIVLVRAPKKPGKDSVEQALIRNDALAAVLDQAVEEDLLEDYSSLHHVIWSKKKQKMNRDFFVKNRAQLIAQMRKSFDEKGVEAAMLEPMQVGFPIPEDFLELSDIRKSDLQGLADLFDPDKKGELLFTYLGKVKNKEKLQEKINGLDGVFWFQQRETLNEAWQILGQEIIYAIGLGLILITLISAISFREKWAVFVALGPPILGCLATLGMLSLLGISIGPIHGLALILVIAIGADYGVMLVAHQDEIGALSLSITMAYTSTMFSFGALILSTHPILFAFGITIASGVSFAIILLPSFDWILTRYKKAEE